MKKLIPFAFIILLGCEENKPDLKHTLKNENPAVQPKKEITYNENKLNSEQTKSFEKDSIIKLSIQKFLDNTVYNVPFYWTGNKSTFFIHSAGELNLSNAKEIKNQTIQFGISDSSSKELLPCIYNKIASPDLLVKNWVEIQKGKLFGLYNYETNQLIEPQFNYLLKSENKIIAKTDSGFVSILLSEGSSSHINFDIINYLKNWNYNYFKKDLNTQKWSEEIPATFFMF